MNIKAFLSNVSRDAYEDRGFDNAYLEGAYRSSRNPLHMLAAMDGFVDEKGAVQEYYIVRTPYFVYWLTSFFKLWPHRKEV